MLNLILKILFTCIKGSLRAFYPSQKHPGKARGNNFRRGTGALTISLPKHLEISFFKKSIRKLCTSSLRVNSTFSVRNGTVAILPCHLLNSGLSFLSLVDRSRQQSSSKKEPKDTPPTGLEPAIFGLGGRRVIHYATEAGVDNSQ